MAPVTQSFGFRPWSEVINETGDRINGGIRDAMQHNDGVRKQNAAMEESNRALHPLAQKYFNAVSNGTMEPEEAAVLAHAEIDANNNGIPDRLEVPGAVTAQAPQGIGVVADAPMGPAPVSNPAKLGEETPTTVSVDVPAGFEQKPQGLMQQVKAPAAKPIQYGPGPQEPLRNRDLPTLELMAKDKAASRQRVNNRLTDEEFERRELIKGGVKKDVNAAQTDNNIKRDTVKFGFEGKLAEAVRDGRMTELEAKLAFEREKLWLNHLDKLEGFKTRLEAAKTAGDGVEIAKIRAAATRYSADVRGATGMYSSINKLAEDPDLQRYAKDLEDRTRGGFQQLIQDAAPPPGVKGEATKTGTSEGFKMKFPDGSVHSVSKKDLEAAKARGAVPTK